MTSEMVIVSGQVEVYERLEKLNTAYNKHNSGTEITGEDQYFFGISLLKGLPFKGSQKSKDW